MIDGNSNPGSVVEGTHSGMLIPCGKYTAAKRSCGFAAVRVCAVNAGTMDSRNGSAIAAPAPRNTVRRDRCILVTIMVLSSLQSIHLFDATWRLGSRFAFI